MEWKYRVQELRRFDGEQLKKNAGGKLSDISSILKVESTSKFPRQIDVIISTWIRLSKSMESRRIFYVEFRSRIDCKLTEIYPLAGCFFKISNSNNLFKGVSAIPLTHQTLITCNSYNDKLI